MFYKTLFVYDSSMDEQPIQETETTTSSNDATLLLSVEEMIKSHLSQINKLSEEIKKHKEMIDDVFGSDQTFQEHDKIAKEANGVKSKTKSEIMKRPGVLDLANKLKDLRSEKTELNEGLSDYLREYQRLSGSNQFQGEDGEVREIVLIPKLVKKSKFRP